MINALLSGNMFSDPQARTTSAGKSYATAQVRVACGEESILIGVAAFGEIGDKLMALRKGDAVAITGELRPNVWTDKQGIERRSWNVTAAGVMSAYESRKRRSAHAQEEIEA